MKFIEQLREFVKKEDPIMWLSLFLASIISIFFYLFAVIFVRTAG